MLNSVFTDEILAYALLCTRRYCLDKVSHIIYKHNSGFHMFEHTALDALGVTELPYLRTLEIDKDIFSIIKRAPNLEQLDITNSPFPERGEGSGGDQSNIRTLRLEDTSSPSDLNKALSFAAKDLRSLVFQSSGVFSMHWVSANVIEKMRDYRHSWRRYTWTFAVCKSSRRPRLHVPRIWEASTCLY
ncbi:hypothetical protein LB504_012208 [Fusarium proliferatum]|nr:hypothetical protein LB504_012208 [Fusarium proliferatum]